MTFDQLVTNFGFPLAALVIVVATGARGTWVFGRELQASLKREEEWKQVAYKALNLGERVVEK